MTEPIAISPGKTIFPGISHTKFVDDTGAIIVDASCINIINVPGMSLLNLRLMNQEMSTQLHLSQFSTYFFMTLILRILKLLLIKTC